SATSSACAPPTAGCSGRRPRPPACHSSAPTPGTATPRPRARPTGSASTPSSGRRGWSAMVSRGKKAGRTTSARGAAKPGGGRGASPFLFEDTVIQTCDNAGGPGAAPQALVALDKRTGAVRWSTPRNQGQGFSTPRLMTMAGGRVDLVLNGPAGLWGYDPR